MKNKSNQRVNEGLCSFFELKDLEVIEIRCNFANRNIIILNMPRSIRKKSKTGIYHVMLRRS